jgi:hypothetical protein
MTPRLTRRQRNARAGAGRALLVILIVGGAAYTVWDVITLVVYVAYVVVGAILVIRRPRHPIGWLLVGFALAFAGTTPPPNLDVERLQAGTAAWDQFLAAWVAGWAGSLGIGLYVGLTQLFPTGGLPEGQASRRLARVLLGSAAIVLAVTAFGPAIPFNSSGSATLIIPNRFALLGWLPFLQGIDPGLLFVPMFGLLVIGVGAMLLRYRRASGVLRLQLRWLAAAVGFVAFAVLFGLTTLSVFGDGIGLLAWLPALVAYPSVPAAIAIAVLRYRLYEIDRIISRTISWGVVTVSVVAAFAAGVLVLQAVLSGVTQGQTLAVAASTLVAFALFQPIRRRVQRAVDRRFDRHRYDAERIVDAFGRHLRLETDMQRVAVNLGGTARAAVAPESFSIWLRPRGGDR